MTNEKNHMADAKMDDVAEKALVGKRNCMTEKELDNVSGGLFLTDTALKHLSVELDHKPKGVIFY